VLTMVLTDRALRAVRRRWPPVAAALSVVILLSAAPTAAEVQEWIRRGNDAFSQQKYEEALDWYRQAELGTEDPGLVAFNAAAACYRLGRYHEAELYYHRCLEDDEAPALRRAQASFALGNALVHQAGTENATLLTQALAAYRDCLAAADKHSDVAADARHNLEMTQLLWLKSKARTPDRTGAQNPEERVAKTEPRPGNERKQPEPGADEAKDTPTNDKGAHASGKKQNGAKKTGAGPLQTLPDEDRLLALSRTETEAHLRHLADQIGAERRQYHHHAHTVAGSGKDW
jgi:tetratricopeptide (TPR) repeat protein